jgi:sterol desaturase/sphingolipid hydroxylase (fatty acid hydroxylase superfamily)
MNWSLSWVEGCTVASWVLMALLVVLELRNPEFRSAIWKDRHRARRNWGFLVMTAAVMPVFRPLIVWVDQRVPHAVDFLQLPFAVDVVGAFLVAELLNWAVHWAKHRSDFLWKFHFQHHRETQFNLWLTAHTHGGEVLVSGTAIAVIMSAIGFSVDASLLYLAFYGVTTAYQHSSQIPTLGVLDSIIVSPRYHRIHHEVGMQANYAGRLTLFDVLFRTAIWPDSKDDRSTRPLGIGDSPREPYGVIKEFFYFVSR